MPGDASQPLLSVRRLQVDMRTEKGRFPVVRDLSFDLLPGETVGIVGESGSGKTVTCLSLLRLIPSPPAVYRTGEVLLEGVDLWQLSEGELQRVRGNRVAVIFQEALSALNPVMSVGEQVAEVLIYHRGLDRVAAEEAVVGLFRQVGISDPEKRLRQYPHQLSGGLQQRVMIAMALAGQPRILIADEPTTALDVTIQVQILELLRELQQTLGMSLLFISHDLAVIAEICRRVLVMYAGQIVEGGPIEEIFRDPRHPYTRLLLNSIPDLQKPRGAFRPIPGQIPSPERLPSGCPFHPRCPEAVSRCRTEAPPLISLSPHRTVRCWQRMPSQP
ncbi:MAG: ABC transporter ATP-binding protein [Calditrichaeota bacterium]|nr:MAG: ABC transporter ATP-binding protein [Calditrichota bacterium]